MIRTHLLAAVFAAGVALPMTAVVAVAQQPVPAHQQVEKHHSKLKGAIIGAAAGHAAGGHAVAGAVAGAAVQHHRNKKAAHAAMKPNGQ